MENNKPQLHALLIAINNYHPDSRVSNLAGCVNDATAMQQLILEKYTDLSPNILKLTNESATREHIITNFRSHLVANAKPKDTVLFYYAGHGSYTRTAQAFEKYDGIKQDETFVCYDSRLPGKHDLTDKEIAVLLSEINQDAHIVVIADSCHSASVTRNAKMDAAAEFNLGSKRFTEGAWVERDVKSYLLEENNYYHRLGRDMKIPNSKHLLISACKRNEEAWETKERRGLFTTSLLSILQHQPDISYTDLFARVRTKVYGTAKNQTPTIYPMEGFNPNTVFLRPNTTPNRKRHLIKQTNGEWRIEYGAIDGLPVANEERIKIGVYANRSDGSNQVLTTEISKILLKESVLAGSTELLNNKIYWGEIQSFPNALQVNLVGTVSDRKNFLNIKDSLAKGFPFVDIIEHVEESKYHLKIEDDLLRIVLASDGSLIHGVKGITDNTVSYLLEILTDLEAWERISDLQNPTSSLSENHIQVIFVDESDRDHPVEYSEKNLTLDYPKKGEDKDQDGEAISNWYQIKVKNNSDKKLFISLVYLGPTFNISTHYPCAELPATRDWITLDNTHGLAINDELRNEVSDIFKVILSTEEFDNYKFNQEGFEVGKIISLDSSRGATRTANLRKPTSSSSDWFTQTITVRTIRKQKFLDKTKTDLWGFSFLGHPFFTADMSYAPITSRTRSTHLGSKLGEMYNSDEVKLLNFKEGHSRSLGAQDNSIIELNNIQNSASLADQPLTLQIDKTQSGSGSIIPVTMKDGFIIPFGESIINEDGSTQILIKALPEGIDLPPSQQGKRSLGRSIWFSLLKVAGLQDQVFLLRKVQFDEAAQVRMPVSKSDIEKAEKILLVIHGIIGDTKGMIKNFEFLTVEQHYDLILTFDYENLNTKIELIATILNQKLEAAGLTIASNKQFDILAHSMGGLVSRYFIEHIRQGDQLVNHLMMFGTPNGGSVFGDIPMYRDKLVQLLTIGLNFGKAWLGSVGVLLDIFNKALIGSKQLTKTLSQMQKDSSFIQDLKQIDLVDLPTKYSVVAGDTTRYEEVPNDRVRQLLEKILLLVGNKANSHIPNDIAVLVEDILAIPNAVNAIKHQVICHHMNYFEEEGGLAKLRELLEEQPS